MNTRALITGLAVAMVAPALPCLAAAAPDLILHHGKIVTVDAKFSMAEAIAITGERITAVGANDTVLATKGAATKLVDLGGKMVLPGLIDSHVHPAAALTEFDHELPVMETIADVLAYIKARTAIVKEGDWIYLRQVFITRLQEQRYPTLAELDAVAPKHPVNFSTGPDNMLNSRALKLSGITKDFKVTDGGPGKVELDPSTGEPNGLLRGLARFVKMVEPGRKPTEADTYRETLRLFHDYNATGFTAIGDRSVSYPVMDRYQRMLTNGELTVRIAMSYSIPTLGPLKDIEEVIRALGKHPLRQPNPMLRLIGTKIWLDGGMLTGSAYMLKPWGESSIYGITDPQYRGVLNVPRDRLLPMVQAVSDTGLQFTAHSVGDGAITELLAVYDAVNRHASVRTNRHCITHSNFMTREAIDEAVRLGVLMDIQPAWLYLDTRTLVNQFGYERLRFFQPLKSIFEAGGIAGGGSDHMQKIGALRSVNPYNPFLAMQTAITREARWYAGKLHPEEALTREQAIRFYTVNNAFLLFLEKEIGSLETGKRADLIVLDRDILTCPENTIKDIQVLKTYLDGKVVFEKPPK